MRRIDTRQMAATGLVLVLLLAGAHGAAAQGWI